jgi:hypothetical protein
MLNVSYKEVKKHYNIQTDGLLSDVELLGKVSWLLTWLFFLADSSLIALTGSQIKIILSPY